MSSRVRATGAVFLDPHTLPEKRYKSVRNIYLTWEQFEAKELRESTTADIMPPGRKLRVIALTQRAGGIRVEITMLSDNELPGRGFADRRPIQGDQFRTLVTWTGQDALGCGTNQPIIIRVKMDHARLFGIQFE